LAPALNYYLAPLRRNPFIVIATMKLKVLVQSLVSNFGAKKDQYPANQK